MITRASVREDWPDVDWDEVLAKSDAEIAAEDAEFEREMATWQREHEARLASLTALQRYRYERHHLLVSLMRARIRLDMYRRESMFDFMLIRLSPTTTKELI